MGCGVETGNLRLRPILSLFVLPKLRVLGRCTFRRLWLKHISDVMDLRRVHEGGTRC